MTSQDIQSALARYVEDAREKLKSMDWLVQGVFGDERDPTFSYTVGLSTKFGHPEIAVVGFDPELCRQILNDAAKLIRDHGVNFATPCLLPGIIQTFDVAFRPVTASSSRERCRAGKAILDRDDYPLVQMFFPDPKGFFPWQSKCDRKMAKIQNALFKHEGALPSRILQ